MTKCKLT